MARDEEWQNHAENKLWELVDGAEFWYEKIDKDGTIHTLRAKNPPNMDAVKFVLKNRSKGKWSDKIEVSHTQVNLNLTASYKQINQLLEQKTQQIIDVQALEVKERQQ